MLVYVLIIVMYFLHEALYMYETSLYIISQSQLESYSMRSSVLYLERRGSVATTKKRVCLQLHDMIRGSMVSMIGCMVLARDMLTIDFIGSHAYLT